MMYISYYTLNTPYEKEAKRYLLPSLKKFRLPHDVQAIPDFGTWQKNTGYKSTFIYNMLKKHKCPVIFLDADAEVIQYPKLFQAISKEYDLGVHWLDWHKMWRKIDGNKKREMLSGTMYVPYKPKTLNLIQSFIIEINRNPLIWEQKSMQTVVETQINLKIYNLPYSYITFPLHNGQLPKHMINPRDIVVLHHQASRRLKNRRNWKK